MKSFISVDPGLSGTGYAVWTNNRKPMYTGIVVPNKSIPKSSLTTLPPRGQSLYNQLYAIWGAMTINKVNARITVVEWPEFFQTSGGRVSAERGDLIKLTMAASIVCCVAWDCEHTVKMVPPRVWKGQLPKKLVITRIKRMIKGANYNSHEWDAVGLGLHHLGKEI